MRHWEDVVRPCVRLARDGDGPVVGRFGGPLLLPADVPDPATPYVATIDLAALPAGSTDLPLPPDGTLLLFAIVEDDCDYADAGSAVHVPAGTAVAERDRHSSWWSTVDEYREKIERFPQGPLRATPDLSLPRYCEEHYSADLHWEAAWPTRSDELRELLRDARAGIAGWGTLQLGGFASEEVVDLHDPLDAVVEQATRAAADGKVDFAVSEEPADWVLLADWHTDISGWEGASVHWALQRKDLEERRFDRVFATYYWNP